LIYTLFFLFIDFDLRIDFLVVDFDLPVLKKSPF